MNPEELKKLIEDMGKAWKEYRDTNDARLKALEEGKGVAEYEAKLGRIDADIEKYSAQITGAISRLDDVEMRVNRMNLGGFGGAGGGQARSTAEYLQAFASWFRKGGERFEQQLRELQVKNALSTESDPDGGFLVPVEVDAEIQRIASQANVMRQFARVISISAKSYEKIVNKGGASAGWVSERGARSQTGGPSLSKIEIVPGEIYAEPAATQQLLDDSAMDIAAWLADELSIAFADTEGVAFISGDGVEKARGFLAYPTVADDSYQWGKIGYVASGKSGAFADSNAGDHLIDLVEALKTAYRNNARWMMERSTLKAIRKLKSSTAAGADNSYLWQPSFTAGEPATILGYPYGIDDNMPKIAAASFSIAFGDFRQAYTIVDRIGTRVLRDPYTAKPYVLFYTTKRVGGGITNYEALKLMKFVA